MCNIFESDEIINLTQIKTLVRALVEDEKDISNFLVVRNDNVQIMIGDWNLELRADGTWSIL